jgi:hypothetical protein
MENNNYENYKNNRLEEQIKWYDKKSTCEKKIYYFLRLSQLILSALIPVLTGLVLKFHIFILIISFFGGAITVIEGIASFTKVHEKWIQYRQICELLKQEKFSFEASAGIYDDNSADVFKTLVQRCESIISSENINWANLDNAKKGRK